MIKLNAPSVSYDTVLDACIKGIPTRNALNHKLQSAKPELIVLSNDYQAKANAGELYQARRVADDNELVADELIGNDLVKIYTQHFAKNGKPARTIYDGLLAANDRCPYCSGIGVSKNLDHYLVKKIYPQFSVLPVNLVPACRDCNMGEKGESYAQYAEEQIIHPYLDDDCFFNEQWLYARYLSSSNDEDVGQVEYYVDPPHGWSDTNKARVQAHFKAFNLGERFAKRASQDLIDYVLMIQKLMGVIGLDEARRTVLNSIIQNTPSKNHWKRVLCQTLLNEL